MSIIEVSIRFQAQDFLFFVAWTRRTYLRNIVGTYGNLVLVILIEYLKYDVLVLFGRKDRSDASRDLDEACILVFDLNLISLNIFTIFLIIKCSILKFTNLANILLRLDCLFTNSVFLLYFYFLFRLSLSKFW